MVTFTATAKSLTRLSMRYILTTQPHIPRAITQHIPRQRLPRRLLIISNILHIRQQTYLGQVLMLHLNICLLGLQHSATLSPIGPCFTKTCTQQLKRRTKTLSIERACSQSRLTQLLRDTQTSRSSTCLCKRKTVASFATCCGADHDVFSYVHDLSPKKQDKALIHAKRAANIRTVLIDKKTTAVESAQFR